MKTYPEEEVESFGRDMKKNPNRVNEGEKQHDQYKYSHTVLL